MNPHRRIRVDVRLEYQIRNDDFGSDSNQTDSNALDPLSIGSVFIFQIESTRIGFCFTGVEVLM